MASFQISDAPSRLELGAPGPDGVVPPGRMRFTVRNMGAQAQSGRIRIEPENGADPAWLGIVGAPATSPAEIERDFDFGGTCEVEAEIRPPKSARSGNYGFRLRVLAEADPDADFALGPVVGFALPEAPPAPQKPKAKVPWWAVAVAVLMVAVVGGAIGWFATRPDPNAHPMPNVVGADARGAATVLATLGDDVVFRVGGTATGEPLSVSASDPAAGRSITPDADVTLTLVPPEGACTSIVCQFPDAIFPADVLSKLAGTDFGSKFAPALSRVGGRIVLDEAKLASLMSDSGGTSGGGGPRPGPVPCRPPGCLIFEPHLLVPSLGASGSRSVESSISVSPVVNQSIQEIIGRNPSIFKQSGP